MIPAFSGEIQLAGWSESHTGGCKVTFWLQSTEDLEPFRALTVRKGNTAGHRFMAALVEIGDDEKPVQPTVKDFLTHEKPKGGPLSIEAASMCRHPEFLSRWGFSSEKEAAQAMCEFLGINSRSEIDHDEDVKNDFIVYYRGPFLKHLVARGIVKNVR
jgi:hypothetical protein